MSSSRTETATPVDVTMPQMGVSVAEGTVVAWRVEVGDRIDADETICEISTDKIDTEVPAPVGGVVTEILVPGREHGRGRDGAGDGSRPAQGPSRRRSPPGPDGEPAAVAPGPERELAAAAPSSHRFRHLRPRCT